MEARKISVKLKRDPRETAERHSQANPLTLECTLASGEAVTETMELRAELHAAQIPATTPLATTASVSMTAGSTGPWELEFSGAQMNQTVLPDSSEDFWLVVYATNAADDLFTLAKIGLTLTFDNVSQVTPAPPEPPLYATYAFRTFAVAGQSSVVAETSADTLTLVAGSNITLTTNATTDSITISATGGGGGGGGDVTGPASSTDNAIARFDGTTGKIIQNSSATLSDAGGIAADTLAISTTPTGAGGTGIFRYDSGEKVPEVGIDGITLKMGVQEYVRVYNDTGVVMTKGQVVYISGAQGNRVAVKLADATSEVTSKGTIGIVAQQILADTEGFVQTTGPMYNLNTIGLTAGNVLFLSETEGEWTATEPAPPAHGVRLAYVERVHATAGSVYIKVDNGYELGELHNVSDTAVGITAFLTKNSSTNVWQSRTATEARGDLGLGTLATQSGTFSGTSSGTNTGNVTLAASVSSVLTLSGQQLQAVTDPASDRILFYDQSASAWAYASLGDSLVMTGTTLSVSLETPGPIGGTTPGSGTFNLLTARTGIDLQTATTGSAGPFRSWNTPATTVTNWERGRIEWASNVFIIGTEANGTGVARAIDFQTGGTTRATIGASGGFSLANGNTLTVNGGLTGRVLTLSYSSISGVINAANEGGYGSLFLRCNNSTLMELNNQSTSRIILSEAVNFVFGTTTGTRFGNATTQRIGFWNATPAVQPTAVADATDAASVITQLNALLARLRTIGIIAT